MAYNPGVFQKALDARSLSIGELSKRLDLTPAKVKSELGRLPEPRQSFLNVLSRELSIPTYAFYQERGPNLHPPIVDFRSSAPKPRALSRETMRVVQLAEAIQRAAKNAAQSSVDLPSPGEDDEKNAAKFAVRARKEFGISVDDQKQSKDARQFYLVCRKKIEDKGIIVIQDSFPSEDGSGFCLWDPVAPLIVINTRQQTRGRRLFTLIHELAHVLLRKTGISDPFVRLNDVEKWCNRFAGAFLVPKSFVDELLGKKVNSQPSMDDIRLDARRLKISQEATALRLEQIGIYVSGTYGRWKSFFSSNNPDYADTGGGGREPPPQEKVKLAKYGFRFARIFDKLIESGEISPINLFRATGLKPQYQGSYFGYARSLESQQLTGLELGDD